MVVTGEERRKQPEFRENTDVTAIGCSSSSSSRRRMDDDDAVTA